MASRTRNRVLGFAALAGVAAVAVIVILLSDGGDGPRVKPLREETARQDRRADRGDEAPYGEWHFSPAPDARPQARRRVRLKDRGRENRNRRAGRRTARRIDRKDQTTRRSGRPSPSRDRVPVRIPTAPGPPATSPAPALNPVPTPATTPPAAAEKQTDPPPATQPVTPKTSIPPESPPIEITVEDGDIEDDLDRVRPQDGRLRLLVSSDRFLVVEVDGHKLSWPVLPGVATPIGFATTSKSYELELRHRKGVLVLRLDD